MFKTGLVQTLPCLLLAATAALPAHANGFTCVDRPAWKELEISQNGVTLNNFSLRSVEMTLPSAPLSAHLSYSITNRSDKAVQLTAQFVFMSAESKPVLAMSAPHVNSPIQPGETVTADTSAFIDADTFSRLGDACYRVGGTHL